MKNLTLAELNAMHENAPCRTSEYEIDGKKYTVKSHFIGDKKIDDVLYDFSFQRALIRNAQNGVKNFLRSIANANNMRYNCIIGLVLL